MGAIENVMENKESRIPVEAKELLKSLASEWEDVVDRNSLQVIPVKGAMTNEVFQIKWPTKTETFSHKVLLRVYGEGVEVFFDRNDEIRTFEFMSKHGQGPRLLGRFHNGRVEEFINARTLSASDIRDPEISALIAAKLKEFHDLDMPGQKIVRLWDRSRNWLIATKNLSPPEEARAFRLDAIEEEISTLEKALYRNDQHIGFCHNDLQYGNIMIDEETKSITLIEHVNEIDFDYIGYAKQRFDQYWLTKLELLGSSGATTNALPDGEQKVSKKRDRWFKKLKKHLNLGNKNVKS
ncbi:probable choline kinase 2 isoform X4 [Citrus clementina]|uniref:probable choline kinase 2 isoform X4 n=1 Tax=Citrus clementina TaxID=85681 RepID=UPI000CED6E41|nr:probable choline kinase 2 isoform X4 [Citrus x clementina]